MADSTMFLANNVLAQINEVRKMNRSPRTLRCDADSFDCLMREIEYGSTLYPAPPLTELRIYGLSIEITPEPNFEVV